MSSKRIENLFGEEDEAPKTGSYTFKYNFDWKNSEDYTSLEMEFNTNCIQDIIEQFKNFLIATGFNYVGVVSVKAFDRSGSNVTEWVTASSFDEDEDDEYEDDEDDDEDEDDDDDE